MRIVRIAGVCLIVAHTHAHAASRTEPGTAAVTHVRGTTPHLRTLLADTAEKSPAFRALLDRLERSTVIVYVRTALLPTSQMDGRIGFLAADTPTRDPRFLVIELSCSRPAMAQAATLAHELRHAIEIADAPWVVGTATLAQYYTQIGRRVDPAGWPARFETLAAQETAVRVRRELAAHSRVW